MGSPGPRVVWLLVLLGAVPFAAHAGSDLCTPILELAEHGREAIQNPSHPDPFTSYEGPIVGGGNEYRRYRSLRPLPGSSLCAVLLSWSASGQRLHTCVWTGSHTPAEAKRDAIRLYEQIKGCFPDREWRHLKVSQLPALSWLWLTDRGGAKIMFVVSIEQRSSLGLCGLFYDENIRAGGCPLLGPDSQLTDAEIPVVELEVTVYKK